MPAFSLKFHKGMSRTSWFLLLFSWFVAAVVVGVEAYGRLQGAADAGLYSLALVLAVLGAGLFLLVRGVAWIMSAFWES